MRNKMARITGISLFLTFFCFAQSLIQHNRIRSYHKLRHKHNYNHFNDEQVNEIRHAFEDYIKVVQHTESSLGTYESEIKLRSPERHSERGVNKIDDLTSVADDSQHSESETSVAVSLWKNPSESLELSRRKNVHAAQSKMKSELFSNNYDEEYDNEEDEKINSKANSGLKVHETREIPVHSLTDYKLTALATNKNIKKVFKQEFYGQQEIYDNYDQATIFKQIRENIMRTKIEGKCRWPHKKVIEIPQQPSKIYTPRKYVIYQCSEETACCSSNEKICVAKKYEELTLWFNVRYVGSTGYESFKVQNHTECECVYKNRQSTTQMRQAETEKRLRTLPYTTTRRPKPLKCKCPTFFDVEITDGMCGCFCKDKKFECRKRYEGREGFTLSDQRCIIHKICEKPHCLYPPGYSTDIGRCPDRHEKIRRGFLRSK